MGFLGCNLFWFPGGMKTWKARTQASDNNLWSYVEDTLMIVL